MLREQVYETAKRRVDAEKGIIYDVKVCGYESENDREYLPDALSSAIALYEGIFVNLNHPAKATDSRSVRDKSAWLEGIHHVKGDGLRGNLHFLLPLDEMQKRVIWAAENKPNAFGLSHNAQGRGKNVNGKFVVEEITEVRSVDIVSDGATVRSLFEGQGMSKVAIKKLLLESVLGKLKPAWKQKVLKRLFEDGGVMTGAVGDAEMDAPAPDAEPDSDPDEALAAGFKAAIMAVVDDDSMDAGAKKKKIGQLITTHEKLKAQGEEEPTEEDDSDKGDDAVDKKDDDKKDDKKDSKEGKTSKPSTDPAVKELTERLDRSDAKAELADLKLWIREQIDARKLTASTKLLESLVAMKERKAITDHLDWLKGELPAKHGTPRSQGSRPLTESTVPATKDDRFKALVRS